VPYTAHRTILTHLIRSYLTTFHSLGLETWLAHGTLLGWWWNGRIMPWDFDVDAQVSGDTLQVLGERYNGSLFEYGYRNESSGREETRVYLLDVNPFGMKVDRGQGENVIDARWIDVETGMFVDITALMERDPMGRPGVVSCKNYHVYGVGDLYPLRETQFEGVEAMVPWEFEKVLVDEYGTKSLVVTEWEG
jgi:phosphorylcholine metabolism protein LicD